MLVAVCNNEIVRKYDAGSWSIVSTGWLENSALIGVAHGNNRWLMCGDDGGIGYGDDIDSLTIVNQNGSGPYAGNTFFSKPMHITGNEWIIVGFTFNAPTILSVIRSTDNGATWANASSIPAGADYESIGDAWENAAGLIVAVCNNGAVMSSTDGNTWTSRDSLAASNVGQGVSVIYDETNSLWIAVTRKSGVGANEFHIYTASDPTAASPWTLRDTVSDAGLGELHSIGSISGNTVVGIASGVYRRSSNGTTWANPATPPTGKITGGVEEDSTLYVTTRLAASDELVWSTTDADGFGIHLQIISDQDDPYHIATDGVPSAALAIDEVWTNNAKTNLTNAIGNSQTSFDVDDASAFATPSGNQFQRITIEEIDALGETVGDIEIVKLTSRSGNTLTVERGFENTVGRQFNNPTTTIVSNRLTAGSLTAIKDAINAL